MPVYEYQCHVCGEKFSLLRRIADHDEDIRCPRCETRHPKRLFSTFAASAGSGLKTSASASSSGCKSNGPFR